MVLKTEDVNYLVYRYLKESGFLHSSYIFQFESQIHKADREQPNVEPGSLIRVLQKGLQYMDVETHLNEDGTARLCTAPFSLVGKHTCSAQPGNNTNNELPQPPSLLQSSSSRPKATTTTTTAAAAAAVAVTVAVTANTAAGASIGTVRPSIARDDAEHGGHTLVHDAAKGSEDMDIDVPDTERDALPPAPPALSSQQRTGKKQRVEKAVFLRGHSGPVFLCAWNPHITGMLATGAGDGTARIWDTRTATSLTPGAEAIVLRHDTGAAGAGARTDVTAIAWNAQGTLLATASFAGQLRIWSTQGELKQTLGSRQVPIIALRWNRKGSLLLSGCLDGTLALWDVANSGLLRHEYRAHTGSVLDVDWLDNTTFASCASDRNISIWHDGTPTPTRTLVGHTGDVNALRWHPSGKYLASGSDDGSLKIWTLNSDTPLQDFVGHAQQVYAVRWMPRSDKVVVASASFDGTVRVWDVLAGTCLRVLAAHTEAVHCLAFSSDGRYLATGSFDKRVRVWSIKDGTLFKSFVADDGIHDVQWAPKGRVAVAIANSQVALFDPLAPSA